MRFIRLLLKSVGSILNTSRISIYCTERHFVEATGGGTAYYKTPELGSYYERETRPWKVANAFQTYSGRLQQGSDRTL